PAPPPPPSPPVAAAAPVEPPVLRSPTGDALAPLAAADVAALMRELPLPTPADDPDDEIPEGVLVAQPATGRRGPHPRVTGWPGNEDLEPAGTPFWRRPWLVGTFVALLFSIGWLLGHSQAPDNDVHATPFTRILRTLGIGGARFSVSVDSD